jgi:hypothetical protein
MWNYCKLLRIFSRCLCLDSCEILPLFESPVLALIAEFSPPLLLLQTTVLRVITLHLLILVQAKTVNSTIPYQTKNKVMAYKTRHTIDTKKHHNNSRININISSSSSSPQRSGVLPCFRLMPSNFFINVSCNFLLPAHASCIFRIRTVAMIMYATDFRLGFSSLAFVLGVTPISSSSLRSALLL